MSAEVEYPSIQYVSDPVHMNGDLTGRPPRFHHYEDCGHFKFSGGLVVGTRKLATPEQMRTLKACGSCVKRRSNS